MDPVTRNQIVHLLNDPYKPLRVALYVMAVAWGVWAGLHWNSMQGIISGSIGGGLLVSGLIWEIYRKKQMEPLKTNDIDGLLSNAFFSGDKELVQALIEAGANPDIYISGKSLRKDILNFAYSESDVPKRTMSAYLD